MNYIRKFYKNQKIGTKLIVVFFLLIIIPEILLSVLAYVSGGYSIRKKVLNSTQETVIQMSENLDSEINTMKNISMQMTANERIKEALGNKNEDNIEKRYEGEKYILNKLNDFFNSSFLTENVYLCSHDGRVYQSEANYLSLKKDFDFTRTEWYKEMKQKNINSILLSSYDIASVLPSGNNEKLFTMINKIYGENGREIGCIIVDMNSGMLQSILQNTENDGTIIIVDDNKRIAFHSAAEYIGTQYRSPYISTILEKRSGHIEDKESNNYIVYSTSDNTNWTLMYELPSNQINGDIRNLKIIIISTTVICVMVSLYLALLVRESISQPISDLKEKMKQVGTGDFDIEMDVDSKDEIGLLSISFDKMVRKTKQLIENVYQSEIYQKEAELNALQAQINPHFLYNTLQTIDIMAENEGSYDISDACQALSKMFRYAINRGQEYVCLQEEINHIKNYMVIQKLRFGKKIKMDYQIQTGCENLLIVKLLIQPLVENAVVHGIENSINQCMVVIRAFESENHLIIQVQDDGEGIPKEKLKVLNEELNKYSKNDVLHKVTYDGVHKSIGLENTNARIKLYFGEEYGVKIRSVVGEGTLVELILPISKPDEEKQ